MALSSAEWTFPIPMQGYGMVDLLEDQYAAFEVTEHVLFDLVTLLVQYTLQAHSPHESQALSLMSTNRDTVTIVFEVRLPRQLKGLPSQ